MITLVVIANEVEESVLATVLWFDSPVEKRSKWVPLHEAVEQVADLLRAPDKLTLYRWQHQVMTMDFFQRFLYRLTGLEHD